MCGLGLGTRGFPEETGREGNSQLREAFLFPTPFLPPTHRRICQPRWCAPQAPPNTLFPRTAPSVLRATCQPTLAKVWTAPQPTLPALLQCCSEGLVHGPPLWDPLEDSLKFQMIPHHTIESESQKSLHF